MQLTRLMQLFLGAGLMGVFAIPVQVLAQEGALEEVVVTARKRAEDIQDVPVAMTALTADDIDSVGVSSMRDYAKLVPNLFLVETQASSFTFVNIRGISQMRNTDPSVAITIDGVLASTPVSMSQELFDVEQIEVYKGPQGALYGRNSLGGAINIRTKRPTNEVEGYVRGGFGNGSSYKTQASISGPLIRDKLLGRASFSWYDTDGNRSNIGKPDAHSDETRNFSGRARLIWTPTDNFEADFRFTASDDEGAGLGFTDIAPFSHEVFPGASLNLFGFLSPFGVPAGTPTPAINPVTGAPNPPPLVGAPAPAFFAPGNPNREAVVRGGTQRNGAPLTSATQLAVPGQAFNVGDVNNNSVPVQNNLNGIDKRRIYNASMMLNWDIDGFARLTATTAYDKTVQFAIGEQPLRSVDPVQKNTQWRFSKSYSQELRLTSPSDRRLRWISGIYLVWTDTFLSQMAQRDKLGIDTERDLVKRSPFSAPDGICADTAPGGVPNTIGTPSRLGLPSNNPFPLSGTTDNQGDCIRGWDGDQQNNFAWALFGQINYDWTDTIELSFSGRFDQDEREQTVRTPDIFLDQELITPASGGLRTANINFGDRRREVFRSFQPKLTVRWSPLDNFMAYATYAKGFRSGGFNRPGIGALSDAQRGTPGIPPVPLGIRDVFPKQEDNSVEVGFKYNTPDGRFVVNADGFYTAVNDMQTFTAVTFQTGLSQVIIPVDEVALFGAEFDAAWQVLPDLLQGLTLTAGVGWTHSEVTKDEARGNTGNPATSTLGKKAPQTPTTTTNIGLQYRHPFNFGSGLGGLLAGNFFTRLDYQRIGKTFFLTENFSERNPLQLFNLRVGVEVGDGWRVEGWSKNLTDQNYFAEGFNPAGFFFPGKLRQYGVEVTKRF
ncbi:MAG: TonB-dependent receptor [Gammaproteobacteria bacterium]